MTWKPLTRPRSNKWTDLLCKRTSSHKWNTKSEIKKKETLEQQCAWCELLKRKRKKKKCRLVVCFWVEARRFVYVSESSLDVFVCLSVEAFEMQENTGGRGILSFFFGLFFLGVTWNGFRLAVAWETVRFFEWKTRCASSVKNVQRNVCLWGDSQGNWHLEGSYAWCLPSLPSFFVRHVETCQFQ
jgi:hypothetical protein